MAVVAWHMVPMTSLPGQVQRKQLALLEYAMAYCAREDIAMMARRRSGNMGGAPLAYFLSCCCIIC